MDTDTDATANRRLHRAEIAPATLEGWFVLHQSFWLDWAGLESAGGEVSAAALGALADRLDEWGAPGEAGWSGAYQVAGGGVDLLLIHFRESLEGLMEAGRALQLTALADFLQLEAEYVSVVEMGLYALTAETAARVDPADHEAWRAALTEGLSAERQKAWVRRRLYPTQPEDMPYVCYYPMDKRRRPGQNWYKLPLEQRAALMAAHGNIGRQYAGRISQVISGSMGLADWEWAVTLWAGDPLEFKNIISEMRYDEASAEYAEFGPFLVGKRMTPDQAASLLAAAGAR